MASLEESVSVFINVERKYYLANYAGAKAMEAASLLLAAIAISII